MLTGTFQVPASPGMHTAGTAASGRRPLEMQARRTRMVHRSAWRARMITSLRRAAGPQRRAVVAVDHEVAVVLQLEPGARVVGRTRRPDGRPALGVEHQVAVELHEQPAWAAAGARVP